MKEDEEDYGGDGWIAERQTTSTFPPPFILFLCSPFFFFLLPPSSSSSSSPFFFLCGHRVPSIVICSTIKTEGEKKWRLYRPKAELARYYSLDYEREEIGKPFLEVTLKAGDVLYFPRGTIHEAETSAQVSTHITLSTYQHFAWFKEQHRERGGGGGGGDR